MRYLSFFATIVYGVMASVLTLAPGILSVGYLSWIAEWWGVVTSAYLFLTALPVAWIITMRENRKASWEWPWKWADTGASYFLVFFIALVVPFLNWLIPGDMLYWQWKIWLISFFAAGVDLMIAIIQNASEENAPV